jgi:Domain of unknown function (DUF1413)
MAELSVVDLELAQRLIDRLALGDYEVEAIYGEFWEAIPNHTGFGRAFKKAVENGQLEGICWKDRTSENHQLYSISGS